MKQVFKTTSSIIALLLLTLSFSSKATLIVAPSITTLHGINNLIDINEVDNGDGNIEYQLNFLTPSPTLDVYAFAVSNNTQFPTSAITSREIWQAFQITASDWDNGQTLILWGGNILTTSLGTFASLFGSDSYVNFFMLDPNAGLPDPVFADTNSAGEFFQQGGFPASQFIALGVNNNIIDQSKAANPVPEPNTLILFLLAIALVTGLSRKKLSL